MNTTNLCQTERNRHQRKKLSPVVFIFCPLKVYVLKSVVFHVCICQLGHHDKSRHNNMLIPPQEGKYQHIGHQQKSVSYIFIPRPSSFLLVHCLCCKSLMAIVSKHHHYLKPRGDIQKYSSVSQIRAALQAVCL